MSELKSETIYFTHENGDAYAVDMYLKSEADKVIAELKKERDWLAKDRAQAYDDLEKRAQLNIKQEESIRHHEYKRCLAMADMNWWQANRYSAAEMVERIRWNLEEARQCSKLEEKYLKRYHKWLELAEKFNLNKSTAK